MIRNPRVVLPLLLAAAVAAAAVMLGACATRLPVIEESLTPAQFFQRAQEASDVAHYQVAMYYYETFLERFPNETDRDLWAKYEVAFLYHKMGKNAVAIEHFDALLQEYASGPADLPQGPKILAEKVRARLQEQLESGAPSAGATPPAAIPPGTAPPAPGY
jgi:tetratricopeptide (TPR) repeat protein